jgi:hypothetical protein
LQRPHINLWLSARAFIGAASLDRRLAQGVDPSCDALLQRRAAMLLSRRRRRQIAAGLRGVLATRPDTRRRRGIPPDAEALAVARPAIEQLERAIRSRRSVRPEGLALTLRLLTELDSVLYCPATPTDVYEAARQALLALVPAERVVRPAHVRRADVDRSAGRITRVSGTTAAGPEDRGTRSSAGDGHG